MTTSAGLANLDREWLARAPRSIQHPLARALLVLTFTTGLVDAVSYLGLGHVFTANMTGTSSSWGSVSPAAVGCRSSRR